MARLPHAKSVGRAEAESLGVVMHEMPIPLALYPPPVCLGPLHTLESTETGSDSGVPDNFWKKFQAKPVDALVVKMCYYGKQ
jgi:hypothetical protein